MSREVVQSLLNAAGYSKAGVAGVLGNVQQESSFDPAQIGAKGELGLFQHLGSRRKELEDFAKALKRPETDPHVQTAFAIKEIQRDYPQLDKILRTTNDPARAAIAFGKIFEKPNEQYANWEGRAAAAQQFAQNLQSETMTDAGVPGYSVSRNANTLENQSQQMENVNEKDQKRRKDTPLLSLYDIYDKANADAISLMAESREFNNAVTDDVIENLRKVAEGGKDYRIQGYKASLKQSLDMLTEFENDESVPREAVAEMKRDLLDHVAARKDASFLDYIINQGRQLTGMSPRVAGNAVGQMAAQNAPTVGTDPFGQETGLPQSLENKQAIARNVSDLATAQFGASRERLPKGVDTAQGIAGALTTGGIGASTRAPILGGALMSSIQSALATEDPTGGNVLTNAGVGLGAGGALGAVLKGGSGLVSGLRGRSAERQTGEMLTQGISEGIGTRAPQAGLAQLGKIEQRFAQRPDIPLAAQGAVDSTFSTVAARAPEYRAIQRITQRLAKTDGPAADVIGKNLARVMDEGAPQRISNMLERTIGVNATAGEVENIVVPAMQQQGRNALQNMFRHVPNLDEKTTSSLMNRMMKSSAYEKAYNEIRTSGLMGDRVVAVAPDSSTQLQQAIRARLNEWNNTPGGALENKLNPEIKALGRYLRVGTRTEAGNPASSMWGAFNDTYANSQAIRRAVEKGQDIEKLAPEAVVTAMGKTSQEQQAFAIGAMQVVRSKLNAANYRVGDSFSNPELNAKVSQALGSPEKTDAFLRWLGEEMQISKTVSGIKGDLNATGEAVQEATGRLKSLLRDPWEVAAIVRGSFLYAASRAAGDVVRSLATGKGASTEAKRLMAAYTTTTDPAMQAKLVDLARAEYIRQYTKHQIAAAASTTGGRVIGEQIGDNEE